jgi:signal transduction histidine kinase
MTAVPKRRGTWIDAGLVGLALVDAWFSTGHEGGSALAVSVLAGLALWVRRRYPYLVFALTLPALFTAYVLVAPLTALYTVALLSRDRLPPVVCAVVAGLGYYLPWPLSDFHLDALFTDPIGLLYTAGFAGAPVMLGLLVRTRRELSARLVELTAGRERERQLTAETVLAAERSRLAREMHDVVSHQVSLIAVQAGALRATAQNAEVHEAADVIRRLSVQTLTELRQMVGVLRSSVAQTPELAPQPRLEDIPRLVQASRLEASLDMSGTAGRRWPPPVERAAYRTVQEALTNIGKHAPGAPTAVVVAPCAEGLRVTVRNGPPASPPARMVLPGGGHGLVGLRERAEQLGGTFAAGPIPDGGFLVEATLPGADETEPGSGPASGETDGEMPRHRVQTVRQRLGPAVDRSTPRRSAG